MRNRASVGRDMALFLEEILGPNKIYKLSIVINQWIVDMSETILHFKPDW